jgi:transposase-like protein
LALFCAQFSIRPLNRTNGRMSSHMMDQCPACSASSYLLADGRRQCRVCRLKFTPHSRQGRLSPGTKEVIAGLFWDLNSAYKTAELAGINRKTAQRIYREFRERMAQENDRRQNGTILMDAGECPSLEALNLLCGIGVQGGSVWVAFPACEGSAVPGACCSYLVLGGQWGARENFVNRIMHHHRPQSSEKDLCAAVEFWDFARKQLRLCRGNFRKEFPLYLKEMVFRFNNPEKKKALEVLLRS